MDDSAPQATRVTARPWLRFLKGGYVLATSVLLGWAVWLAWNEAGASPRNYLAWGSLAFVLCWMCIPLLLGIAWAQLIRCWSGVHLTPRIWLPLQAAAWAGRYLPGKLGLLAGRLTLLPHEGLNARSIGITVLFEQMAFVLIGAMLAMFASFSLGVLGLDRFSVPLSQTAQWVLRILVSSLLAAGFLVAFSRAAKCFPQQMARQLGMSVRVGAYHLLAHVICGLGFYLLMRDLWPQTGLSLAGAITLLAAANVAGMLAVFAPAGLGVRELVLAAGLATWMTPAQAIALAAMMRILSVLADFAFVALAAVGRTFLGRPSHANTVD